MSTTIHELDSSLMWLTALLEQLQAGDEVILTRQGQHIARLVPVTNTTVSRAQKRKEVMERARRAAALTIMSDVSAARSQDFLYDEYGLPA